MEQILSSFGKKGTNYGLLTMKVDIEDTSYLSKYFTLVEFNNLLSAGKNPLTFNGSPYLKEGSEIKIECIDSNGNYLYIEYPKGNVQYTDMVNFLVSIHVYDENYNGNGKLILVGTSKKGEIVRWKSNIVIDKTLQNESKVRFYYKPTMEIRPLLYPVVSTTANGQTYDFTGSFYSYAAEPPKDTLQSYINKKHIDIDYRILLNPSIPSDILPSLYPTHSFNTQMEGQTISLYPKKIQTPYSYVERDSNDTIQLNVKKIIDSKTLQVENALFAKNNGENVVINVNNGTFTASYQWIPYSANGETYQSYTPIGGETVYFRKSYAELIFRNIEPFSGFVARHKLYKKSLNYPGNYELISDSPIVSSDLLADPITSNNTYSSIGKFFNQLHINKYWKTFNKNVSLTLEHSVSPFIDSMKVYGNGAMPDGNSYVIAKLQTIGTTTDSTYYPYDPIAYNYLSGSSYTSNFISLKKDCLYELSFNILVEKEISEKSSKVEFYFTSSNSEIAMETTYNTKFGLNIATIAVAESVKLKMFKNKQKLYFTPKNDYFGTLIIVPSKCNFTISDLSIKSYGDYGFSPKSISVRIPFPVNTANEAYSFKSELFDVNSKLVYSDLQTVQTFDTNGESLFAPPSNVDPSKVEFISGSVTISQSLYLPNNKFCPSEDISDNVRLVAWHVPLNAPPEKSDGEICYTNIDKLNISNIADGTSTVGDYISIGTINSNVESVASALSVKYDGQSLGRKIVIQSNGTKITYN